MLRGSKVRAGARLYEPYLKEKGRKAPVREMKMFGAVGHVCHPHVSGAG